MSSTIFIHGAGGSAAHWTPLLSYLSPNLLPFFYELPGHGDREDNIWHDILSAINDFGCFVQQNKLTQFNLVAHSLGGLIALQFSLDFPCCVKKMVLISTSEKIIIHPDFIKQIYSRQLNLEFLTAGFAGKISEHLKQQVIDDLLRLNFCGESEDFMGVTQYNLSMGLNKISMPTLILIGESDRIISPRRSRELGKKIPSSTIKIISNAAHYPHLENIKVTASYINEFLDDFYGTNLCV